MDAGERFAALVGDLIGEDGVTPPGAGTGFGAGALKVDNRIFAMLAGDHLVVKLPRARVDELVAAGEGVRFDGGKGTPMKEWFAVGSGHDWAALAREALAFVGRR